MARFFSESDFNPELLQSSKIAILGFGNQGRAHALNLRDSGFNVIVGARTNGQSYDLAESDGFLTLEIDEAAKLADVVMVTLPDEAMAEIYRKKIEPNLAPGNTVLFAHGFNIVYHFIKPDPHINVGMVSPKGAGAKLRSEYLSGRGLAALVAIHQDPSETTQNIALAYAHGLGAFRNLVLETSFREETHSDLFGEQTVLCGGIPELLKAGFETLVNAGYSPEAAYFECIHEAKLITDLIYDRGIAKMRKAISNTAEWGGFQVGETVINSQSKQAMKVALEKIQSGEFAENWMNEAENGLTTMQALENQEAVHPSEPTGKALRQKMGIEPI